jgi:hypothetical protein
MIDEASAAIDRIGGVKFVALLGSDMIYLILID